MNETEILLKVEDLVKYFPVKKGILSRTAEWVKAVDGISFHIAKGETLGLVGESGCGKTTAGRTILRLIEPTKGKVIFEGKNIFKMSSKEIKSIRCSMQIIFQDPFSSLNPRMLTRDIIGEGLDINRRDLTAAEKEEKIREITERVGLNPEGHLNRYPHEFSGGQRQRIGLARALVLEPKFLVLDEPSSALDVSVQARILNLLSDMQQELGLTYLFISHDMSVIKHMSNRIAVMYLGKIVELAPKEELFRNPLHPYTIGLLASIPSPHPKVKMRIGLSGEVPSPINPPKGCYFNPRCPYAKPLCQKEEPNIKQVNKDHLVACHFVGSF